ncbi:unnamed protein product [Allacma fusca]|uniref:Carbonic anhydrase n=1 Tax=Allacma fusca TaxID=39272 RepID=A0A8J2J706_9HEXA|nr:unnamed protein product [Allacma fusca]
MNIVIIPILSLLLLSYYVECGKIPAKEAEKMTEKSEGDSSSSEEVGKTGLLRMGRRYNPLSDEEEEFCYHRKECGPTSDEWPGVCQTGMRQSPIDINFKQVVDSPFGGPVYLNPDYRSRQNFLIMNTGHTVSVMLNSDLSSRATIRVDGAKELMRGTTHIFSQLHFHWGSSGKIGSEHTINGQRFAMEAHFVHYNSKYENFTAALNEPDGIIVVAVFFDESPEDNPAMEPVVELLDKVHDTRKFTRGKGLEFTNLLPVMTRKPKQAYHYLGSLTTPGCVETVSWVVFEQHLYISTRQLEAFRSLIDSNGDSMQNNFRPTQPLNNRKISRITVFCGDNCLDTGMMVPEPPPSLQDRLDMPFPFLIIGPKIKKGAMGFIEKALTFINICIYIITILWILFLHKTNAIAQTSADLSNALYRLGR